MKRPKVLVMYFSRSGTTHKLAQAIENAGGWDLDPIVDRGDRTGVLGYLRSALEAVFGLRPTLRPSLRDPAGYDLVIVGSPVWGSSVSSPVRSYLDEHAGSLPRLAFFV